MFHISLNVIYNYVKFGLNFYMPQNALRFSLVRLCDARCVS
jgi:hypothetical protein